MALTPEQELKEIYEKILGKLGRFIFFSIANVSILESKWTPELLLGVERDKEWGVASGITRIGFLEQGNTAIELGIAWQKHGDVKQLAHIYLKSDNAIFVADFEHSAAQLTHPGTIDAITWPGNNNVAFPFAQKQKTLDSVLHSIRYQHFATGLEFKVTGHDCVPIAWAKTLQERINRIGEQHYEKHAPLIHREQANLANVQRDADCAQLEQFRTFKPGI